MRIGKNKMIIMILIILGLIIYIDQIYKIKENYFNLNDLRDYLRNNIFEGKATVMNIKPEVIDTEDCYAKCGVAQNCNIMQSMKKNLLKCVECHKNPNKCFRKSIIGGNCDDCEEGEVQMDCSSTKNFGCIPPMNTNSDEGTLPYFIKVPEDNLNSPYDKKCVFCWQIPDYF